MSIWVNTADADWIELSKHAESFVERVSEREDLAVIISPDMRKDDEVAAAPIPAGVFYPHRAVIELNASLIFDKQVDQQVGHIDPNSTIYQNAYQKFVGVLVHESAHAKHSQWHVSGNVNAKHFYWAKLLEETRIERKILEIFPHYARFIKSVLTNIVYSNISGDQSQDIVNRYSAAHNALLVAARETIGIIDATEITKVVEKCKDVLGDADYQALTELWEEAQNIDDDYDLDSLLKIGEKIQDIVDEDDDLSDDAFGNQFRMPCGGFASSGEGDENGEDSDESGEGAGSPIEAAEIPDGLVDAIAISVDQGEGKSTDAFEKKAKEIQAEKDKHAKRQADIQQAKDNVKTAQSRSYGFSYSQPRITNEAPTEADMTRMRVIEKELRKAQYRDVHRTVTPSLLPPGRLQIREAMNRQAQIDSKQVITATPWKQTRRRVVDNPPLTFGVSTDISGSMSHWQRELSSFTWAAASAVKRLQGKVGAVAWNTDSYSLIPPNQFPNTIPVSTACGGSSGVINSLKALDGMLNLGDGEGVRVVAVLTDGELPNLAAIQTEINHLAAKGVIVAWLLTTRSGFAPKNAQVSYLRDPKQFGVIMGKLLVDALANA